jgi:hypothetical protein
MIGEEGDFTDTHEPRLDISRVLFEYFTGELRWADSPEAFRAILGERALAMGNLLLNTEEPLTLPEIATQAGLTTSDDLNDAYRRLGPWVSENGPLRFLSIRNREKGVTEYQIVTTSPVD